MSEHPARRAFDSIEQAIARPLERALGAPEAAQLLVAASRASMWGRQRVAGVRSALVHIAALPSIQDIRVLSAQVSRLQRNVEEVEQLLQDLSMEGFGEPTKHRND
ncbi:hypothetical protein [Rhodococcus aetherivorans]|uniref:hypothetical protein n=1 Tax=Rhodococcus aetherivorans TaxID=191292 RepID=UPI00163A2A8A|nr:hypothetical protein [Rhodococcus aetherivorans]MBC2589267.1 hypothetical protein [Rhodococcus aetherivorans]